MSGTAASTLKRIGRSLGYGTTTALLVFAVACGGGEGGGEMEGEAGGEAGQRMAFPVDTANAGGISGSVAFEGTAPEAEAIDMSEEPTCAEKHEAQPMTRHVVVNENGTLANVFVYVKSGLDETLDFPTPADSVPLDQDGCRYQPHVFGIQTAQTLAIMNSDGILHNINATPEENRGFNISQPTTMTSTRSFPFPEVMIPVKCDVHGWMNAYIGVRPDPYYDTTGGDGSFGIDRLPPGDYVVEAWHERYGTMTQNVTVAAGETAEVSFTYSADMAEGAVVPLGEPIDLHEHGASDR